MAFHNLIMEILMSASAKILNKKYINVKVKPKKVPFIPRFFTRGFQTACRINKAVSNLLDKESMCKLDSIEGRLNIKESLTLFYFTFYIPCKGRIVEIGSFKGKSTTWMAAALKLRKSQDKIVSIDPHINTHEPHVVPEYHEKTSYESFVLNLSQLGLFDYVQPIRDFSKNAADRWDDKISLLFIDGSHRYQDVLDDLNSWEKWVNKHGIIIMHDTDPAGKHREVIKAVVEYRKKNKHLKKIFELKNMTVFEKT